MSLEGIGELFFTEIVRRYILKGYTILPPGTVRVIDTIVSNFVVVVEIEDSVKEIYSGTKQLLRFAEIARLLNADFLLIAPLPERKASIIAPATYFFKLLSKRGIKRKELWFVTINKPYEVISLKLLDEPAIRIRPRVPEKKIMVKLGEIYKILRLI